MRIGFISTLGYRAWGGSEALWVQTAARLAQGGVTVAANVGGWEHTPGAILDLEKQGCPITSRGPERPPAPPSLTARIVNRIKRAMGQATVAPHFTDRKDEYARWLADFRPDLVIISQGYYLEGIGAKSACLDLSIPYVALVHSAGDCGWPGDDLAEALAHTYEKAARAYFVSHGVLNFTRRVLAAPLPDARIVRNPFNVTAWDEPLPWPEKDEPVRLACLARLECVQKGQDLLIEALRAPVWRERPLEITFYGDGPNRGRMGALADMYGVRNVVFAGHDPDVTGIWRRTHGLILSSRYEGLPMVVVEAMLCGRPCIVTDVMGSAELLEDGVTGFVAAAATPGSIGETLERAWQQRDDWREMGQRAAAAIRQQVPADPIGVFAAELRELAVSVGARPVSASETPRSSSGVARETP